MTSDSITSLMDYIRGKSAADWALIEQDEDMPGKRRWSAWTQAETVRVAELRALSYSFDSIASIMDRPVSTVRHYSKITHNNQ